MKRCVLFFACLLGLGLSMSAAAVDYSVPADPAALQSLRERLKSNRKSVISENLKLTDAEATRFWPLYTAFQREVDAVGSRRSSVLLELIQVEDSVSEANAERMMEELSSVALAEAQLRQRFFAKFAKAISPIKAARYYQVEARISALNRLDENFAIHLIH